jgi:hypothetical protein
MGWDEPLLLAMQIKTANKINGFRPVSYGMTVKKMEKYWLDIFLGIRYL